jgi:hypothetical protein
MEKWELVVDNKINGVTERLKVDGGYLYRIIRFDDSDSVAMSFVPDVDLQRYQAHLRDAYNKGYSDGQEDAKHGVKGE